MTRRLATSARVLDPGQIDAVLAGLMLVELELEIWLTNQPSFIASYRPLQSVAAVFYAASIALRRRSPTAALLVLGAVALAQAALGGYLIDALVGSVIPPAVLGYGAGSRLEPRRSAIALVAGVALFWSSVLVSDVISPPPSHAAAGTDLLIVTLLIAGPWLAGRLARERNQRAAAFRRLAAQVSAERQQRAQVAVADERIRIGRELQDIIIHSVSVMVVQAGAARRLVHTEPGRARDSVLSIEHTGRDALADLRRLLGMMRKDEDPRALAPQPGLNQVASLLARLRTEGVECDLATVGDPIQLTPGVDLVGYRVIERTLRLMADHKGHSAAVTIRYAPPSLDIQIAGPEPIAAAAQGLRGISDRVELYEGSLELGTDDGFSLHARLPLPAGAPV